MFLLLLAVNWLASLGLCWISASVDLSQKANKRDIMAGFWTYRMKNFSCEVEESKLVQILSLRSGHKNQWQYAIGTFSLSNLSWATCMPKALLDPTQGVATVNFIMKYTLRKGAGFIPVFSIMNITASCLVILLDIDWTQLDSSCNRDTWS